VSRYTFDVIPKISTRDFDSAIRTQPTTSYFYISRFKFATSFIADVGQIAHTVTLGFVFLILYKAILFVSPFLWPIHRDYY